MTCPSGEPSDDGEAVSRLEGRSGNTATKPFAAVPHDLLADKRLTPIDKVIAATLLFWAQSKAACWPSNAAIAERANVTPRSIPRSLDRLEELGYVRRVKDMSKPAQRVIVIAWHPDASIEIPSRGMTLPSSQDDPGVIPLMTLASSEEESFKKKPETGTGVEDAISADLDPSGFDKSEPLDDWTPPDLDCLFEPTRLDRSDRQTVVEAFRGLATRRRLEGRSDDENRDLTQQDAHAACLEDSLIKQRRFLSWANEGIDQALPEEVA